MSFSLASKRLCSSLTSMKMVSLAAWAPFTLFENCKSMDQLKQMHAQIIETGFASDPAALSLSRIIVFCCAHEFGDMKYARQVFDRIPEPSVFIWNTMIKGYSRTQCAHYGISMYASMQRVGVNPDCYTFPFLLRGFTCDVAFEWGRGFHAHVLKYDFESNVSVHNALVHMYSVCGQVDMARGVFDTVSEKDVATWNAMISGYNKIKKFDESWKLFCEMEKKGVLPTSVTLVSVLSACSKLKDLDAGKQVQNYLKACVVKPNLVLENALIDMFAACGEMDVALEIFEDMKRRDVISWTTTVKGFCGSGQVDLARNYFDQMPDKRLLPCLFSLLGCFAL
ncbi:hypothetical protein ACLB2K_063075 [Fragaria x ananassa]